MEKNQEKVRQVLILSDFLLSELSAAKIPFLIVVVARYFISVKVTPDRLSYRLGPRVSNVKIQ